MSSETKPFAIDVQRLKSRPKDTSPAAIHTVDRAGEQHGFVAREATGRRGRPPSPRTGQVHAKVLPHIADEIAAEATRRGVTQGILIEEAWALYLAQKPGK
jgi:hypothetical protein